MAAAASRPEVGKARGAPRLGRPPGPAASDRAPHPKLVPQALQNSHARERRLFEDRVLRPLRAQRWKWTEQATKHLEDVVTAQLQEDGLRQRFQERAGRLDAADPAAAEERQRHFLEACGEMRRASLDELMQEYGRTLDWMYVAEKMVPNPTPSGAHGTGTYMGAASCKIHYYHALDRNVKRDPFDEEEDVVLSRAVEEIGNHDWDGIAEQLGTQRTAWQCYTHYWRHLRHRPAYEWTAEEDRRLQYICREVGLHSTRPWQTTHEVAAGMDWGFVKARFGDGPTEEECKLRWWRTQLREGALTGGSSSSTAPAVCAGGLPAASRRRGPGRAELNARAPFGSIGGRRALEVLRSLCKVSATPVLSRGPGRPLQRQQGEHAGLRRDAPPPAPPQPRPRPEPAPPEPPGSDGKAEAAEAVSATPAVASDARSGGRDRPRRLRRVSPGAPAAAQAAAVQPPASEEPSGPAPSAEASTAAFAGSAVAGAVVAADGRLAAVESRGVPELPSQPPPEPAGPAAAPPDDRGAGDAALLAGAVVGEVAREAEEVVAEVAAPASRRPPSPDELPVPALFGAAVLPLAEPPHAAAPPEAQSPASDVLEGLSAASPRLVKRALPAARPLLCPFGTPRPQLAVAAARASAAKKALGRKRAAPLGGLGRGGRGRGRPKARRRDALEIPSGSASEFGESSEDGEGGHLRRCMSCGKVPYDAFDTFCAACGAELGAGDPGEALSPCSP